MILIVAISVLIVWIWSWHSKTGLPYTKKRKRLIMAEQIRVLEWEENVGDIRKWKVERTWDGRWKASGPSPRWVGRKDTKFFDLWVEAQRHAFYRASECSRCMPYSRNY